MRSKAGMEVTASYVKLLSLGKIDELLGTQREICAVLSQSTFPAAP